MGLFDIFKKSRRDQMSSYEPYKDSTANFIYNLLFCDNLDLFKRNKKEPHEYPYDILFSDNSSILDLQKIIDDPGSEPRIKILAYNSQLLKGHISGKKELLGVIVEVGLDEGLDVLASFNDGSARYINYTGKVLIWENTDDRTANEITRQLFEHSNTIVNQIGPWDKARKPYPTKDHVRITFLVSDGLYFGEGPGDVLFNDPLASPAMACAGNLMQYLTQKYSESI